jgi:outer membrane protein assembly factor BamB
MTTRVLGARASLVGSLLLAATLGWSLSAGLLDGSGERPPGHSPQWRGPDRNSVSKETGLLKAWPDGGPPLAWSVTGLGDSVASVAVAGGRVFTLGKAGDDEVLVALDEATGKKLWSVAVGPASKGENALMRWLSPRTPTVDDDRVYAVTARGDLACFRIQDGALVWRKNYVKDFQGRIGAFGCGDRPLVDGDRLICTPCAKEATVVALDRKTGEVLWRCAVPGSPEPAYCATTVAEVGGVRHYVAFLSRGPVGVAARDGRFLWQYNGLVMTTGNNYTPLVRGDLVLCASAYGQGMALLKLSAEKDEVKVEEVWRKRMSLPAWHDGVILAGDHLYVGTGRTIQCLELATGKVVWEDPGAVGGAVSMAAAEGNLYLLSQKGEAALIEATPKGYVLRGRLQLPGAVTKPGATAPVLAGGRLYLRDDDRLFCYDVRDGAQGGPGKEPEAACLAAGAPREKAPDEPDAVFVPTPQDVVERMTEAAGIRREDLVCDLGCGDGRIVVTAARRFGCRAVGYDIDPECVRLARENVRQAGVADRVRIEQRDIFTADLRDADVVMLYLSPELNKRLLPQLSRLKPGARVVSHAFAIPGVPPDQVLTLRSDEDHFDHTIYVWTTPLKPSRGAK